MPDLMRTSALDLVKALKVSDVVDAEFESPLVEFKDFTTPWWETTLTPEDHLKAGVRITIWAKRKEQEPHNSQHMGQPGESG